MQDKTLLFLHKPVEQQLLLAMKKRGFGTGKWNGVGGKLEPGETIEQATIRETHEEIGVIVPAHALVKKAELTFQYDAQPEWDCLSHAYFVESWDGEPTESDEMRPQWFHYSDIPFHSMWEDDRHWLPRVLSGKFVRATFWFDLDGVLVEHKMHD